MASFWKKNFSNLIDKWKHEKIWYGNPRFKRLETGEEVFFLSNLTMFEKNKVKLDLKRKWSLVYHQTFLV